MHTPTHTSGSVIHPSPVHSTVASAINPPVERMERVEKDESKREIDHLRKQLFDKEREVTIQQHRGEELKELLEEAENLAMRRKKEMQELRRQLAEMDDELANYERIK